MTVIKRMKHKKKDGSIIEADIGALAKNIEEDDDHRFVTDNEKKTWNEKLSKDGDMAESTVSSLEETQETFPKPKAGDKQKTLWGKIVKWQQDCLTKFGNYVLMSMLTNQHLNSTNNIPTSALVYLMQQAIQQNQNAINVLNTKADNIAPDDSVGKIYARNDKSRTIGFGRQAYDDVNRSILSAFYEDEKEITRIDLIPNNRFQTEGNCKITDIRVDYTKPIWQLIVEVWIDGTLYAKSINFNG